MKILAIHNHYLHAGGEDHVFADETGSLEDHGHEVLRIETSSKELLAHSALRRAATTIWNSALRAKVVTVVHEKKPHVVHVHNTFPVLSPAVLRKGWRLPIPLVHTLHNYRYFCCAADCVRNGRACIKCLGCWLPYPGVIHGCYRSSRPASSAVAAMLAMHRLLGTYSRHVDLYIAPTRFAADLLVSAGLLQSRVVVKPHFLRVDPGVGARQGEHGLFVGRLSPEKGISTMLAAWMKGCSLPELRVVGDGPERDRLEAAAASGTRIRCLGQLSRADVLAEIGRASFLVFPSISFETQGLAIVEAFARGVPVLASRHGAMGCSVEDRKSGLLFDPGDDRELQECVLAMRDPELRSRLSRGARERFEVDHSPDVGYRRLIGVYEAALGKVVDADVQAR